MKCPECDSAVEPDDKFCTECGHRMETPEATAEPVESPSEPSEPAPEAAGPAEAPDAGPETAGDDAEPAPSPPPARRVVLRVPAWIAADWASATFLAVGAIVIGFALQYLSAVLLALLQVALDVEIDWPNTLRAPVDLFTAFHGPIENVGLWATSMLWIVVGFLLMGGVVRPERTVPEDAEGSRWAALIAKTAVIYVIPITVLAALLDPEPLPTDPSVGIAGALPGDLGVEWNVATTFFLGLVAAILAVAMVFVRRTGRSLLVLLGIGRGFDTPRWLAAAWSGGRRVVLISLPALLALLVVGTLLEALNDDVGAGLWFALLLSLLLSAVIWAGLDVSLVFALMSMRFFIGDGEDFVDGLPAWMWIGAGIVAIAFVLGGLRAAERFDASTAAAALGVGLLVGPVVGCVLFAISWFAIGTGEVIIGPAIGLPLLWSAASGIGGLLYANRKGLVAGIDLQVSRRE